MKRDSDFSLTAKSVWTEKPRKSGKTDLARTREQRFGALDSLDGEQVRKVRLPGRIDVVGSSRDVL